MLSPVKIRNPVVSSKTSKGRRAPVSRQSYLSPIEGPELVFGLVGPIGTDMNFVSETLSNELSKVRYRCCEIKVSKLLHDIPEFADLPDAPAEKRYNAHMDAGNKVRKKFETGDALALLAVAAIRQKRKSLTGSRGSPSPYTAYLLNQFKHPKEIHTLRKVYGTGFILIAAYSSREIRLNALARKISEDHFRQRSDGYCRSEAQKLISRDQSEEDDKFGQNVRETFPLGDVFIDVEKKELTRLALARFVEAYFGYPFHTPTRDEFGIYVARAVSLRSADLSRQVGAAVLSQTGEVLSIGCNEVPRSGGGQYWENDADDLRDYKLGYDPSAKIRNQMLAEVLFRLNAKKWLVEKKFGGNTDKLLAKAQPVMRGVQLMDVLEFGRIVHGEMAAISDAARLGISLKDGTLYSTTFPCHICARHIVASGISRVVYIEPYPKSMAAELYPDSIEVEGDKKNSGNFVKFEPFIGIAPKRYAELFRMRERKEKKGRVIVWKARKSEPVLERLVPAYLYIETAVVHSLSDYLRPGGRRNKIRVGKKHDRLQRIKKRLAKS